VLSIYHRLNWPHKNNISIPQLTFSSINTEVGWNLETEVGWNDEENEVGWKLGYFKGCIVGSTVGCVVGWVESTINGCIDDCVESCTTVGTEVGWTNWIKRSWLKTRLCCRFHI